MATFSWREALLAIAADCRERQKNSRPSKNAISNDYDRGEAAGRRTAFDWIAAECEYIATLSSATERGAAMESLELLRKKLRHADKPQCRGCKERPEVEMVDGFCSHCVKSAANSQEA